MKVSAARIGAALVVLAIGVPALVAYGRENASDSAHHHAPLLKRVGGSASTVGRQTVDKQAPTAPSRLRVEAVSRTTARVSWSPSTDNVGVAGYAVSLGAGAATKTRAPWFPLSRLKCGARYQVTAVAYDEAGNTSLPKRARFATSPCAFNGTVSPPAPPSPYLLPAHARVVSSSAGLISALRGPSARNIVLADGTYSNGVPFKDRNGSHLYAESLGGAVLTVGLVVGGNSGPGGALVQGLAFNVSNPDDVNQRGEIYIAGDGGKNTTVLDSTFEGNGAITIGVNAFNANGFVARRLTFSHFTDEGIRASDNVTVAYGAPTPKIDSITDISVNGVSRSTAGSSDGTAEAGLWIGHPVVNGVHRIKIRNVAWSGIESVNDAWDTTYTDLDIDMSGPNAAAGVAVYLEHFSYHLVFDRFVFEGTPDGFNAEWNDPAWGGVAAAHGTTIENGMVNASGAKAAGPTVGVFLDQGTDSTTVRNVAFKNQSFAGIDAYNVIGENKFSGNTYETGVRPLSTAHW